MSDSTTTPRRGFRLWILLPVFAFLTLGAWGLSSPPVSSPDDDFHIKSIWCAQGLRDGLCEPGDEPDTRKVPAEVNNSFCYAFNPRASAACTADVTEGMREEFWLNVNGLYPPLFYLTWSWAADTDLQQGVVTIRLLNSALIIAILTGLVLALPRRLRSVPVTALVMTSVPLGLFIFGSTNPSSWALLSAAVIWVALYGASQVTGRRQWVLCAFAVLGALMGAGARADAAMFAVFGVAVAAVLSVRRSRNVLLPAVTGGLIVVIAAVFFLSGAQGSSAWDGLPNSQPALTNDQLFLNLLNLPDLYMGIFTGGFYDWGLGWLDTKPPTVVRFLSFGVFAGVVLLGLRSVTLRRGLALLAAAGALVVVPYVLLMQSDAAVGDIVQPRYIMPLMVIFAGLAVLLPPRSMWTVTRYACAAGALAVSNLVSLYFNIRRYTTGVDDMALDPGANAEWWWSSGPSPLAVWLTGSAAFAGVLLVIGLILFRSAEEDGDVAVGSTDTSRHGDEDPSDDATKALPVVVGGPVPTPAGVERSPGPDDPDGPTTDRPSVTDRR